MNQGAVFFNKTCSIESNMQHSKMTLSRNNEYDFFFCYNGVFESIGDKDSLRGSQVQAQVGSSTKSQSNP